MSKEAAQIAQENIIREDLEARFDSREVLDAHGEYSRGDLEEMGSLELLDGYAE
jgi:hypothetical protein